MSSWFGWSDPPYRSPARDPAEVVCDTLMLELWWQMKEAGRLQRERESEYRRLQTGVDYSWLVSAPRTPQHNISTGERLGLEDLCSKIPPSYCGLVILKFREVIQANEPEVHEVSGLFRSVLLQTLEQLQEEQEAQRLARQWSNNHSKRTMSLVNFRSRIRINPFGSTVGLTSPAATATSDLKTVSEDVEKGLERDERSARVWSMPDFRYKESSSSKVV